jgi:O-acetyl-ADP-ribose deacetylase (regulator of RNase III)
MLRSYRNVLKKADSLGMKKIAFPALCTGRHGYALERAARLAARGITEGMPKNFGEVRVVCDKDKVFEAFSERLQKV